MQVQKKYLHYETVVTSERKSMQNSRIFGFLSQHNGFILPTRKQPVPQALELMKQVYEDSVLHAF